MDSYILASDIGSGACKTILMDTRGNVAAAAQQEYPTYYPRPGWVEQNPEDWYRAFCTTVQEIFQRVHVDGKQILGVGFVGVTHNCVLLGKKGRPLFPSILMFDTRSGPQVRRILERWGDVVFNRTLNDLNTTWTWPQLLWIRENNPKLWRDTRRILFAKDFVRNRLAPSEVTDTIEASGSSLFDPIQREWILEFCDDLGLDPAVLPQVAKPFDVVTEVGSRGSRETGIAKGTPVVVGSTDTAAEVFGAGANHPGMGTVKLASVGRIAVVSQQPIKSSHVFNYRHVLESLWYPGTGSKCAASAYRWIRDILYAGIDDDISGQQIGTAPFLPSSGHRKASVFALMDEEAQRVPPGSAGLLFHPHLLGEWAPYWDDRLRGDFLGLTSRHGRGHLLRAVLEGVALAIRDALTELKSLGGNAHSFRLIGQGSKSRLWSQILSDVLDVSVSIPKNIDAVYGGALITAVGMKCMSPNPDKIDAAIAIDREVTPDSKRVRVYNELFEIYRQADNALRDVFHSLHRHEHRSGYGSS